MRDKYNDLFNDYGNGSGGGIIDKILDFVFGRSSRGGGGNKTLRNLRKTVDKCLGR